MSYRAVEMLRPSKLGEGKVFACVEHHALYMIRDLGIVLEGGIQSFACPRCLAEEVPHVKLMLDEDVQPVCYIVNCDRFGTLKCRVCKRRVCTHHIGNITECMNCAAASHFVNVAKPNTTVAKDDLCAVGTECGHGAKAECKLCGLAFCADHLSGTHSGRCVFCGDYTEVLGAKNS